MLSFHFYMLQPGGPLPLIGVLQEDCAPSELTLERLDAMYDRSRECFAIAMQLGPRQICVDRIGQLPMIGIRRQSNRVSTYWDAVDELNAWWLGHRTRLVEDLGS